MSDEYSLHTRFLLGLDSAAEYERRLARLRKGEAEREEELAAATEVRPWNLASHMGVAPFPKR